MKQREPSRKLLALALAPLLGACAASSVVPDPEERDVVRAQKLDAQADLSRLKHGRDRFVHRCSSCHDLPSPRDLKPEEWPEQVADMAKRAKLQGSDQADIVLYVQTVAGRE